jgi:nitroimidazol reductase NimA-like FMN-containing flavoprotein (pyridoxamine 5'-phosphate oxidase superfamily)
MNVTDMTRQESIDILSASRLGRLACARENQPYVVPFHYVFSDNHLYSFSLMGQKVEWMRQNGQVCVQVDQMESYRKWQSVVVFGAYEELPATTQWERERGHAWSLLQQHANWWEPGDLKPDAQAPARTSAHLFYRIRVETVTGRRATDIPVE